jgi:hypothetical protein
MIILSKPNDYFGGRGIEVKVYHNLTPAYVMGNRYGLCLFLFIPLISIGNYFLKKVHFKIDREITIFWISDVPS